MRIFAKCLLPWLCIVFLYQNPGCHNRDEYEPPHDQVPPPAPPTLIQPLADTIYNVDYQAAVLFEWTIISDAEMYEIQIDTNLTFTNDTVYRSTTSPLVITLVRYQAMAVYFSRIRAGSSSWTSYTGWSEPRRFYLYPEMKK